MGCRKNPLLGGVAPTCRRRGGFRNCGNFEITGKEITALTILSLKYKEDEIVVVVKKVASGTVTNTYFHPLNPPPKGDSRYCGLKTETIKITALNSNLFIFISRRHASDLH
jgi:hypothetical protein